MTAADTKLFISYRREETAGHAGRLYDAVAARFGDRNVFMDVDMAPGVDFVDRITQAVAACDVLLVVTNGASRDVAGSLNRRVGAPPKGLGGNLQPGRVVWRSRRGLGAAGAAAFSRVEASRSAQRTPSRTSTSSWSRRSLA